MLSFVKGGRNHIYILIQFYLQVVTWRECGKGLDERGASFLSVNLLIGLSGSGGQNKHNTYFKKWRGCISYFSYECEEQDKTSLEDTRLRSLAQGSGKPGWRQMSSHVSKSEEAGSRVQEVSRVNVESWSLPCFMSLAGCGCPWTPWCDHSQKEDRDLWVNGRH